MARALDVWREEVRGHDPKYQRKLKEEAERKRRREESAKRKTFLTRRVKLPAEGMNGRALSAALRSLEKQITTDHLNLRVDSFSLEGNELKIIFEEEEQ